MGGDHGHHHKVKIPDYKIYKIETIPELMAVKRALEREGLKDPWLRNEVWKYDLKQRGTPLQIWRTVIGRGMLVGLVAGAISAVIEKVYLNRQHARHHAHDHGHGGSGTHH